MGTGNNNAKAARYHTITVKVQACANNEEVTRIFYWLPGWQKR